jgi:hypothetical protein
MIRLPIVWPEGKRFAFTVFDDPDAQTLEQCRLVYSHLSDLGFQTTIGVWPLEPGSERRNSGGETCANPAYREWIQRLQNLGFEVGFHNGAPATLSREEIREALDRFENYFGSNPSTMANHYNGDALYWGPERLGGLNRILYQIATLGRTRNRYFGERIGHVSFWGDLCRDRIRYCRNFVFRELNTLKICPWMPYHDPARPFVNYWYASAEGNNCKTFLERIREQAQDQLEQEGGAAILYTHFAHGYCENGSLNPQFKQLTRRLSQKNAWFVPVAQLLRFLETHGNGQNIPPSDLSALERRWLRAKLFRGTS